MDMPWEKKPQQEDSDKKKEKLLRKALGKDTGRKVFGFQCSPKIWASMKELATKLNVPMFALLEHALQLGAIEITEAIVNPEEREILRTHIVDVHAGQRLVEKVANYDKEAAEWLDRQRQRQFETENVLRKLLRRYGGHVALRELDGLIEDGMRYRINLAKNKGDQNGLTKQNSSAQKSNPQPNQPTTDEEGDDNSEDPGHTD
jgi:hypothetical protein